MAKPLFRWTVGPCLQQGLDILAESIYRTTAALGVENWDWLICYNGLDASEIDFIKKAIDDLPVQMMNQSWTHCPVPDNCQTPKLKNGSFQWNGNKCGGTLWKVCPARVRMESHEIVMDNDVVLLKAFPQIEEWLKQKEKSLILEEPIMFYGKYAPLFDKDGPHLNSGFMGFPPGYNFGSAIFDSWVKNGRHMNLSQADEQGLLTYTLNQIPSIRIKKEQMVEVLHRDVQTQITGNEQGIHFTQSNKIPNHNSWGRYKELMTMVM